MCLGCYVTVNKIDRGRWSKADDSENGWGQMGPYL